MKGTRMEGKDIGQDTGKKKEILGKNSVERKRKEGRY